MDCSPQGSSVHGMLQARILERVAISSSKGSSQSRDPTRISRVSCIGRRSLYHCARYRVPAVTFPGILASNILDKEWARPFLLGMTRTGKWPAMQLSYSSPQQRPETSGGLDTSLSPGQLALQPPWVLPAKWLRLRLTRCRSMLSFDEVRFLVMGQITAWSSFFLHTQWIPQGIMWVYGNFCRPLLVLRAAGNALLGSS